MPRNKNEIKRLEVKLMPHDIDNISKIMSELGIKYKADCVRIALQHYVNTNEL